MKEVLLADLLSGALSRESADWAHGHRGHPHVVADGLHRLAEILA